MKTLGLLLIAVAAYLYFESQSSASTSTSLTPSGSVQSSLLAPTNPSIGSVGSASVSTPVAVATSNIGTVPNTTSSMPPTVTLSKSSGDSTGSALSSFEDDAKLSLD